MGEGAWGAIEREGGGYYIVSPARLRGLLKLLESLLIFRQTHNLHPSHAATRHLSHPPPSPVRSKLAGRRGMLGFLQEFSLSFSEEMCEADAFILPDHFDQTDSLTALSERAKG